MADVSRIARALGAAAVAVALGVAASGCDAEDDSSTKPAVCGSGTSHGCFDLSSYGNLYCTVQQTRSWLDDDSLEPGDLPAWADTSSRDGQVQVFDFRDPPQSDLTGAQYTQQLLNAVHAKGLLKDTASLEKRDACLDGLTQQKVAATEGGWPAA